MKINWKTGLCCGILLVSFVNIMLLNLHKNTLAYNIFVLCVALIVLIISAVLVFFKKRAGKK